MTKNDKSATEKKPLGIKLKEFLFLARLACIEMENAMFLAENIELYNNEDEFRKKISEAIFCSKNDDEVEFREIMIELQDFIDKKQNETC